MHLKKGLILTFLLACSQSFTSANPPPHGQPLSRPSAPHSITRKSLDSAFGQKARTVAELMKVVQPKIPALQEKLMGFGSCNQKAHTENWMKWRNSQETCGSSHKHPDEFRRAVVKELEEMAVQILEEAGLIPDGVFKGRHHQAINWFAIGTPGPNSDIDTVAQETVFPSPAAGFLPKIVAEVRAKSLFDVLGIALYGQPTGVAFDTESYIDVTDDLAREGYLRRIQNPLYQNLAITLAFTQVARQLAHGVSLRHQKGAVLVYAYEDFHRAFSQSLFSSLLDDAHGLSAATYPDPDPRKNIENYVPIIHDLAVKASTLPDNLERAKLKGVLATYFPESYFSRESLAHVCYSDDRYSQLLLTLIGQYRGNNALKENSGDILPGEVEGFKNQTITPNPFIYMVSALENLGYFFHKLGQEDRPYDALKNAAKYLFRIARALAGYWGVGEESMESPKLSPEAGYVADFYRLASRLERLKRGFLPFSSPGYIESVIRNVNKSLGNDRIKSHTDAIYTLYNDIYTAPEIKRQKLEGIAKDFQGLIHYDAQSRRFDVNDGIKATPAMSLPTKANQNKLSLKKMQNISQVVHVKVNTYVWELVSLMNLVIGVDSDPKNMKLQKIRKDSDLQSFPTPTWNASPLTPVGNLTDGEFKSFLNGLVIFMKHTLEDFAKRSHLMPQAVGLGPFAQRHIAEARGQESGKQPIHAQDGRK